MASSNTFFSSFEKNLTDNNLKKNSIRFLQVVFLIGLMFSIPTNNYVGSTNGASAISEPVITREKDSLLYDYGNGTFARTLGLPERVYDDSVNQWVDSIISENSTHVSLNSGHGKFQVNKQSCEINMLNDDDSVRTTETYELYNQKNTEDPVSGTWVKDPTNNADCELQTITSNSTGVYIPFKRIETESGTPTGNEISITFKKENDKEPKWDASYKVGERSGQKYDNKFMWLWKTKLADSDDKIEIIDSRFETDDGLSIKEKDDGGSQKATNTKFDITKEEIESAVSSGISGDKTIKYFKSENSKYRQDYTPASDLFQDVSVQIEDGVLVTFARYVDLTVPQKGDTLFIDPAFSSSNSAFSNQLWDSDNDDNCENSPASVGDSSSPSTSRIGEYDSDLSVDCYRSVEEWSISSVPDTALVTDLTTTVDIASTGDDNCNIVGMTTNRPAVSSASDIWSNFSTDSVYISNNSFCQISGSQEINLGETGRAEFQDMLLGGTDWFAYGIQAYQDTGAIDNLDHTATLNFENTLTVVYQTAGNFHLETRAIDQNDSSITSNMNIIQSNSSNSDTKTVNSTGYTKWTGLTGYQNFTLFDTIHNFILNQTINYSPASQYDDVDLKELRFDVDCSDSGTGTDFTIMVNGTDGHHITNMDTPTCSSDNVITFPDIDFTANGNDSTSYSSIFKIINLNTTHFGNSVNADFDSASVSSTLSTDTITSNSFTIGSGLTSDLNNVLTIPLKYIPDVPTSPSSTTVNTTSINIEFTAPTNAGNGTISGYYVEADAGCDDSFTVLTSDTGSTNAYYNATGLNTGTCYDFRMKTINEVGNSNGYSSETQSYTVPSAPTGLTANQQTINSIKLTWAQSGTVTGFKIEKQVNEAVWNTLVENTGSTDTEYVDSENILQGNLYEYRVSAINSGGTSSASSSASATVSEDGGGGGGSGGGGGGGSASSSITDIAQTFDDIFDLNLFTNRHFVQLGQSVEDQLLTVKWDSNQNIQVTKIEVGENTFTQTGGIITLPQTPFTLLSESDGLSEGSISYSIFVPENVCSDIRQVDCVAIDKHIIPITITVQHGSEIATSTAEITVELISEIDFVLFIVILAVLLPVIGFVARKAFKGGKKKTRSVSSILDYKPKPKSK